MKVITCGFIATFSLLFQSAAFADEVIDSTDFQYLVCEYFNDQFPVEDSLDEIEFALEDYDLSSKQERILDDIEDGDLSSEEYCGDLEY